MIAGCRDIMDLLTGGVAFGGIFNGNPISLAGAHATLEELSRDNGAAIHHANRLGEALIEGIRAIAGDRRLNLLVTGFGAAFSLHFTARTELHEYRDILDDDAAALQRFLRAAVAEGIHLLPDGRFYLSTAHTGDDIAQTLAALSRIL